MSEKIDAAGRQEIARIYTAGASTTAVAAQFGISQGHVSKILKQEGVAARPRRRPSRFDSDAVKVCEGCGAEFRRGVTRSGREEKAWRFAERRFCSKECRNARIGSRNKEIRDEQPWTIGKRTLLAKTCPTCHELLPASRFQRQERGYYATNCGCCIQRDWLANIPADKRGDIYRARGVQQKRRNEAMRPTARRHGELWTGPELELIERRELSAAQVGAMIGRTLYAVRAQRRLLDKADPVKTFVAGVPARRPRTTP